MDASIYLLCMRNQQLTGEKITCQFPESPDVISKPLHCTIVTNGIYQEGFGNSRLSVRSFNSKEVFDWFNKVDKQKKFFIKILCYMLLWFLKRPKTH